jgi:Uma2 family endonuclease
MVVAAPSPLTAVDLLRHPDGKRYELIRGQLVEREMSSKSTWAGLEIGSEIRNYVKRRKLGWTFGADQGFTCFDDVGMVRKPDVSFIALDRYSQDEFEEDGFCSVAPDLVVEVVSRNDITYDVEQKRDLWLNAGVRLVWIVNPQQKTVGIYTKNDRWVVLRPTDTLDGGDVLPGFSLPLADLFKLPTAP